MIIPTVRSLHYLTIKEILEKACDHYNLEVGQMEDEKLDPYAYSKPITTITVTQEFLAFIKLHNFEVKSKGIFMIIDGQEGKGWSFSDGKPREFSFVLRIMVDEKKRGVVVRPQYLSTAGFAICDRMHIRLAEILSKYDCWNDKLGLMERCCEEKGDFLISWGELGLAGIRSLRTLTTEFIGGNPELHRLMNYSVSSPFDPDPNEPSGGIKKLFVKEEDQYPLLSQWKQQQEEYARALILAGVS